MRSLDALRDGIARVTRAPVILGCVYLITFAAALPLSLAMRAAIAGHLGASLAGDQAARGVHVQWWSEFAAQGGTLVSTFQTSIIGFAAVLDNLSTLADRRERPAPILWAGALYVLLWVFLSGGIIDRYARMRATRSHEFFTASGVYFVRFLRLVPIAGAVYYLAFAVLHPLLFGNLYEAAIRDITDDRLAFAIRLSLYLVFGAALAVASLVFDYARIRAVVEDRRSMIGAVAAGARFVRRNAGGVAGLYVLNGALFVGVLALYALVAPGAESTGVGMWLGFAVGQLYILARLWVRLVFFASETSLFQGRLAHAGYLAGSPAALREPPIVEAIVQSRTPTSQAKP